MRRLILAATAALMGCTAALAADADSTVCDLAARRMVEAMAAVIEERGDPAPESLAPPNLARTIDDTRRDLETAPEGSCAFLIALPFDTLKRMAARSAE